MVQNLPETATKKFVSYVRKVSYITMIRIITNSVLV